MRKNASKTLFSLLLLCTFAGCASPPLTSTGTITQLKFEQECFDLDKGKIEQSPSLNQKCGNTGWDFVFAYNSDKNPHAVLFLNTMSDVKIAYSNASYTSISLSDALSADFSSTFQDRSFETAMIQTSKNSYFKVHKLSEKLARIVTFEWEKLK